MEKSNFSSTQEVYYLIILFEYIDKLTKKVVAYRLTYLTGWYNLISGSQFEGKANFSISDTILIFIYNVHNLWNYSLATFTLTFDIKGYLTLSTINIFSTRWKNTVFLLN